MEKHFGVGPRPFSVQACIDDVHPTPPSLDEMSGFVQRWIAGLPRERRGVMGAVSVYDVVSPIGRRRWFSFSGDTVVLDDGCLSDQDVQEALDDLAKELDDAFGLGATGIYVSYRDDLWCWIVVDDMM